ncbi:MAG: hypothetical protein Q4A71_03335 [Actinomycetaceae bacterium]|nr:hypothetical protein [Actinomycetaceae bacterium]
MISRTKVLLASGMQCRQGAQWLSAIGSVMVFLAIASFFLVNAYYDGASNREGARNPSTCSAKQLQESQKSFTRLHWVPSSGPSGAHGYLFQKATGKSPSPPGIDGIIGPGEVALSPKLLEKYPIGSESPWGTVTASIKTETLSNPDEQFFYAVTSKTPADWGECVDGFGGKELALNGDRINLLERTYPQIFFIVFLLLPGLTSALVGAFGSGRARRAASILQRHGASRGERMVFALGATVPGLLVGFFAQLLLASLILIADIRPPFMGITILAEDVRPFAIEILSLPILILIAVALFNSIAGTLRPKQHSTVRFEKSLVALSRASVLFSLIFLWVFVTQIDLRGLLLQIVFILAVFSLGLAIPVMSIWSVGTALSVIRKCKPEPIIVLANAKLRATASPLMWMLSIFSLLFCSLGASQLYITALNETMAQAELLHSAAQEKVFSIPISETDKIFDEKLVIDLAKLSSVISVDCSDQKFIKYSIPGNQNQNKSLDAFVKSKLFVASISCLQSGPSGLVREVKNIESPSELLLYARGRTTWDSLNRIATAHGTQVRNLREDMLIGAKILAGYSKWFVVFGSVGSALMLIALLARISSQFADYFEFGRVQRLLDLKAVEQLRFVFWIVTLPVCVSALLGVIGYKALASGFASHSFGVSNNTAYFSTVLLLLGLAGAAGLSIWSYYRIATSD